MADYAFPALICLIEGESSPFSVKPKEDIKVMDLKDLIHEKCKNGVLFGVDAADLLLWKVRMIMGQRHHN
jgi:hypothetical protein